MLFTHSFYKYTSRNGRKYFYYIRSIVEDTNHRVIGYNISVVNFYTHISFFNASYFISNTKHFIRLTNNSFLEGLERVSIQDLINEARNRLNQPETTFDNENIQTNTIKQIKPRHPLTTIFQ